MIINLIACVNKSLSIGDGNDLLYHIKDDLKRFKHFTEKNVVIMGRTTYESLPKKPLQNRFNIVLTRDKEYKAEGCFVASSIDEALEECITHHSSKEIFVIGGGKVYDEFLAKDLIERIFLTIVDDDKDGNVKLKNVFDEIGVKWKVLEKTEKMTDAESNLQYQYMTLERINKK